MALIFSRLARNFVRNGYFPTDDDTLQRVQSALMPALGAKTLRLLDPCCGTGAALADLCAHLVELQAGHSDPAVVETYGVEFDPERAWQAKQLLYRAVHADVHDVVIQPRSMSLLFLNPPYGYGVSDSANAQARAVGDGHDKAERLERTFLKRTAGLLMQGGVLVYIVPFYALDEEIRAYLARHFTDLRCFMAPTQAFQQCVILGRKTKPLGHPDKAALALLTRAQAGELKDQVLPEQWNDVPYTVPAAPAEPLDFRAVRIEPRQLADELQRFEAQTLWHGFGRFFNQAHAQHRRPLRDMTPWHLALALAAGQVTGLVESAAGRRLLIKGNTHKRKERSVSTEVDADGNVSQTVTMLDRFVPVINAIDCTPGPNLGKIVRIS